MKRTKVTPPEWARDLVIVEGGTGIVLVWYNMWRGYHGKGNASPWRRKIVCWGDPDKSNASLCLVLHEITHIIVDPKEINNPRRMAWHGPAFQKKVIELYEKYGVLDYAEKWESYKRIRRAITKYKTRKTGQPAQPPRIIKINIKTLVPSDPFGAFNPL